MLRTLSATLRHTSVINRSSASAFTPSSTSSLLSSAASPFSIPSSLLSQQHVRTFVIDRATRAVSLRRRSRRVMLRKVARTQRGAEHEAAVRQSGDAAELASFQTVAANLHQFVAFLHRQHAKRQQEKPAAVPESVRVIREAVKPAWALGFDSFETLMNIKANNTFRACEEIVGALSDPTTDLGVKGLEPSQYKLVADYISRCMQGYIDRELAGEKAFLTLSAEQQYRLSGAYSVMFLLHSLNQNKSAAEGVLQQARQNKILPAEKTLLGQAMKHDVYPAPQ